jgi:hypothetical protein
MKSDGHEDMIASGTHHSIGLLAQHLFFEQKPATTSRRIDLISDETLSVSGNRPQTSLCYNPNPTGNEN